MVLIDSSALVAMLADEVYRERVVVAIEQASQRWITPIVRLETTMVLSTRLNINPLRVNEKIGRLLAANDIGTVPITDTISVAAILAFERYGKGRGHPARLNMADCLIYAAAKSIDASLLFIGHDFIHTDIRSALDDPRPYG